MTRDETLAVLAHMGAAWPKPPLQPEQVEVWVLHMADVDCGLAKAAAIELEAEEEFFPRIVRFRTRCSDLARRRAAARGIGPGDVPRVCELCAGTGWMPVATTTPGSVGRCRCRPVPSEHRSGCACMDCAYGPERAARIRAGQDGTGQPEKDSLRRTDIRRGWEPE